jgi:septal ring factor EnvC (AmiA/AmiB activator)
MRQIQRTPTRKQRAQSLSPSFSSTFSLFLLLFLSLSFIISSQNVSFPLLQEKLSRVQVSPSMTLRRKDDIIEAQKAEIRLQQKKIAELQRDLGEQKRRLDELERERKGGHIL